MRKVYGISKLTAYLTNIGYPLTEEQLLKLIKEREIPHLQPYQELYVFNLDHIDWWVSQRQ